MPKLPAFITFTGADDHTDIKAMGALAALYPIEWGILFSPKRQGQGRYPSLDFLRALTYPGRAHGLRLSAHLCGGDARQVIEFGRSHYDEPIYEHFGRVQINTADATVVPANIASWARGVDVDAILQCREGFPDNEDVAWLYDASGGRGIKPDAWPSSVGDLRLVGYAGGLSPENVASAAADIGTKSGNFWLEAFGA